jgi:nicotinic acid mononucleotide adenylyltransferase
MDWHHTIYWKPPTEPDRIAALEQRVAELEAALQRVPEAMVSGFENMLQKAMS